MKTGGFTYTVDRFKLVGALIKSNTETVEISINYKIADINCETRQIGHC